MNLLTTARDLRRRKARERQGFFVAEGLRTVEELVRSSLTPHGVLYTADLEDAPRGAALLAQLQGRNVPMERVTSADFASAADTESPQGVLAVAAIPDLTLRTILPAERVRLLVLDAVQDPGNVGTILRTAAAFGVTATFSLPGTVDLWNAKVVRSAMGANFHHPCLAGTWDELESFCHERTVPIWGADAAGESIRAVDVPPRLALVVGNEGGGLSAQSRDRAERLVALPIGAAVESLNVAVATGILLYELHR